MCDKPPAPRFARCCPPSLVGVLARIWAWRFASGALMKLTASLGAPQRKTPTPNKPRDRPTPGGSAEGAGGLSHILQNPQQEAPRFGGQRRRRGGHVTPSARPTTSHPVSQKPRTRRQVCPPPERSEAQGGRGRPTGRAAGGGMSHVLHDPQQATPAKVHSARINRSGNAHCLRNRWRLPRRSQHPCGIRSRRTPYSLSPLVRSRRSNPLKEWLGSSHHLWCSPRRSGTDL